MSNQHDDVSYYQSDQYSYVDRNYYDDFQCENFDGNGQSISEYHDQAPILDHKGRLLDPLKIKPPEDPYEKESLQNFTSLWINLRLAVLKFLKNLN